MLGYPGGHDLVESDLYQGEEVTVLPFEGPVQQKTREGREPGQQADGPVAKLPQQGCVPVCIGSDDAVEGAGQRAALVPNGL